MEGQFFVEYLGSSTLPKGTTGLGLIQKPLKEYYTSYHKSPKAINVQEVTLRLSPRGVVFIFRGDHSGQNKELFFDMSSIIYIEAVRFTVSKGTDKKIHSGFLPIEDSRLPVKGKDKIFSVLDKKHHFLTQMMAHPPLLTCVMRRTSGVKALDCHVFIVGSDNDASRIVSYVDTIQRGHSEPPPRGEPEMYGRNDGLYREPPGYWGQRNQRMSDEISDGVYSKEIRRGDNTNRYSDGYGYTDKQRDNYPDDRRGRYPEGPGYYPGQEHAGGYYGKIPDRRERNSGSDRGSQNEPVMRNDNFVYPPRNRIIGGDPGPRNGYGSRENYMDSPRSPREPQHNIYSERIEMRDPHDRGEYRYERRSGEMRSPRSPYEQSSDPRPLRAMSPGRGRRSPVESPRSPRSARSPVDVHDEPVYSASNMENRRDFEKVREEENRRFGKVPPHVTAGVKVLPSITNVKLKKTQSPPPVKKKPPSEPMQESQYIDDEDPYDNYVPREGYFYYDDEGKKQILTGSGWKDDKENLYGHRNDVPPDVLPRHERIQQFEKQREQNAYGNFIQNRGQSDYEERVYPGKNRQNERNIQTDEKPWTFQDQFMKYQSDDQRTGGKSPTETGFSFGGDNRRGSNENRERGKDDEIESMFSYLHVDHSSSDNLPASGENFEQSLGYFP